MRSARASALDRGWRTQGASVRRGKPSGRRRCGCTRLSLARSANSPGICPSAAVSCPRALWSAVRSCWRTAGPANDWTCRPARFLDDEVEPTIRLSFGAGVRRRILADGRRHGAARDPVPLHPRPARGRATRTRMGAQYHDRAEWQGQDCSHPPFNFVKSHRGFAAFARGT